MVAKLLKIQARTDFVDEVYGALVNAICDGSLAPGVRITQEEIADQLAVSRSPVLQALRLLKKDGLIKDAPGRGVLVAPLGEDSLAHIYQIRGSIDSLAARLAAQRRAVLNPALIERGRHSSHDGDVHAMIDADIAFHFAVYAASGNPLIAETARVHWVHLRRVMGAMLQVAGQRASIWEEHASIARAIAEGNVKIAMELSEFHTARAFEHLRTGLQDVISTVHS
ncbi:GntR family transcriptional regulator [Paraburkholderia sp. MM5482-R1]|uniref:GntR family transcriptional regulator n=1 Tax=unclassified Paraburkholderia TaxID=2615204 RepID=UPI003D2572CB